MAESDTHIVLVRLMLSWISSNLLDNDSGSILVDLPETNAKTKPQPVIDQYRPDIFVYYKEILIIGEAKTERDLERSHSKKQFESYIRTCEMYDGKSYLIVSVPCFVEPTARNMLKNICRNLDARKTEIRVVSKLLQ